MKMNKGNLKLLVCCSLMCSSIFASGTVGAASLSEFRAQYAPVEQQTSDPEISDAAETAMRHSEQLQEEMGKLKGQLEELKEQKTGRSEDVIRAISVRLAELEEDLKTQSELQMELLQLLEHRYRASYNDYNDTSSRRPLVNPAPYGNTVSYTQDASNAQGNSTMTFSYAPDQLYKIYCRTGYLTDIELKKGEQISFVGGGDTSSWAVNAATVAGVPHIYVKPVVQSSTTNMIITTNKRSYQLILTVSDWYNPMVRWSYGLEDMQTTILQNAKDEQTIIADLSVISVDKMNSSYKVSVKGNDSYTPELVFDDGEKTIIRMNKGVKRLPALFIREPGKKDLSLANFKTKNNCYIIDRIIDRAELRFGENDIVKIERKK